MESYMEFDILTQKVSIFIEGLYRGSFYWIEKKYFTFCVPVLS